MYKFKENDIFFNTVTTYPKYNVLFYKNNSYINNQQTEGTNQTAGLINYFETNNVVSASAGWLPYEFSYSSGSAGIVPITFSQGSVSSSIQRSFIKKSGDSYDLQYTTSGSIFKILAASNTINYYKTISQYYDTSYFLNSSSQQNKPVPNYLPSSSTATLNPTTDINIIEIPSAFYGRNINPGSVDLQFYITGALTARAQDIKLNGELIQTTGSTTGSVVGIVLYNEGLLIITGSDSLNNSVTDYYLQPTSSGGTAATSVPKWIYFGAYKNSTANSIRNTSYIINFEGTEVVPTLTMLAHANKNDLNWSNNISFLQSGSFEKYVSISNSNLYVENSEMLIKNTISSSFLNYTASFKPQTFINSIGIYDEAGDLIGVATVANPVKKTNEQDYTFKLKIDL